MQVKLKDGSRLFDKTLDARAAGVTAQKGVAIISTQTEDWDGDIIHVLPSDKGKGWIIDLFNKHGRVLWMHDHMIPAIGKGAAAVDKAALSLMMDYEFDMADPFAAGIAGKYERGYLDQWSVGFMATQYEINEERTVSDWWPAFDIFEATLLECSAVNIPANPAAQTIEQSSGSEFTKNFLKSNSHLLADDYRDDDAFVKLVAEVQDLKKEVDMRLRAFEAAAVRSDSQHEAAAEALARAKQYQNELMGGMLASLQKFGR